MYHCWYSIKQSINNVVSSLGIYIRLHNNIYIYVSNVNTLITKKFENICI